MIIQLFENQIIEVDTAGLIMRSMSSSGSKIVLDDLKQVLTPVPRQLNNICTFLLENMDME